MENPEKLDFYSWLENFQLVTSSLKSSSGRKATAKKSNSSALSAKGRVYFFAEASPESMAELLDRHALDWQRESLVKNDRDALYFLGTQGPVWIFKNTMKASKGHEGLLDESSYAWSRDQFGGLLAHFRAHQLKEVEMTFIDTDRQQELGALCGLEMSVYQFRSFGDSQKLKDLPKVQLFKVTLGESESFSKEILHEARVRSKAVSLARHLVNMPPNQLNPASFVRIIQKGLKLPASLKINVWNTQRLVKEKMGLHLGVGQGAEHGPCMVHLSYRPKRKSGAKPIAFVGKGITFDTGGLDIKPSAGMRLMKKDMGGAAAVMGLALWVAESNYEKPCDFYLALAENAIDSRAFRPSDILTARNGMKVEIDNTDAEGRLVLADSLDVAVTQVGANEPEMVINVATLTGAIKVGLGAEIAGLFSNDDELAMALNRAGQRAGDLNWRMPLFDKYFGSLSSPFADCKNSGDGFGGAITAALFLQKFVRNKKWAHLDVYAWTDKAQGPFTSSGGNGQPVQCLIEFLESQL